MLADHLGGEAAKGSIDVRARSRLVRAMVVSAVVLGWLVPEWASAQIVAERALDEPIDAEGAPIEPARFELSTGAGVRLGLGGLGPSLGAGLVALVPASAELGVPLGSRALITVGLGVSVTSSESFERLSASLPLGLLVYLDAPRAGAFVPMLRAGLIGTFSSTSTSESASSYFGAGALLRGGLTWFPVEALGLRAEIGVRGDVWTSQSFSMLALGGDGALSLGLRL